MTVFSSQVWSFYRLWPTKRTALHNYKRQASLVSQKPSVELKLTYKILGKDENIRRKGAQENRTKIPLTNQERPNNIYPSLKQLWNVLLSKRRADVSCLPCWGFHLAMGDFFKQDIPKYCVLKGKSSFHFH